MGENSGLSTELKIPGHLSFLLLALSFIEESAKLLPFSTGEVQKIRLASEEALSNVITHALGNDINENFRIVCTGKTYQFEIHVYEKGKPFDPEKIPVYDPKKAADNDLAGLGTYLMKSVMDEIHYNNLGRDGKETVLVKYSSEGRVDFEKLEISAPKQEDFSFNVRLFQEKDAVKVSECAYFAYGYSYEPFIYYPAKIVQMNEDSKMVSAVAETENGGIAGHLALKFSNNSRSAELGTGFVNPSYRKHNVFKFLTDFVVAHAASMPELKNIFVTCVTKHIGSQKTAFGSGFRTTALMLAMLPSDLNFKSLGGGVKQKESGLVMCMNTAQAEPQTIYLPDRHKDIILDLIKNAGVECALGELVLKPSDANSGELFTASVIDTLNIGQIYCHSCCMETPEAIRHKLHEMCLDQIAAVFIYLDMTKPASVRVAEACEEMGFIFCGVQPFGIDGHHALILQYLNNVRLDFNEIKLADDTALRLREYIEKDYRAKL